MSTLQKYGANPAPATSAVSAAGQSTSAVAQTNQSVKPFSLPFPRWYSLVDYFDKVLYPYLLSGDAPIHTPDELALMLLQEFEGRVGVAEYSAWIWSYCAEVAYLFNMLGETQLCVMLTLRGRVVSAALHDLYLREEAITTQTK